MEKLREWIKAERGRGVKLADELGVSPSAFNLWIKVPAQRVLLIEQLTGVSRYDLRPDVFEELS